MLKDLVKSARTNRAFNEDRKISREELEEFVDITRYTPCTMNTQPLKYRLVYEKNELDAMLAITSWGGALPELDLPPKGQAPTAYIVICHDRDIAPENPMYMIDVGICAETVILAANEAGLKGCILGSATEKKLRSALSIPENLMPKIVIALGKGKDNVKIVEPQNGSIKYFRDEEGTHYVPKRPLKDIIL